jgi:hypothetical protein
MMRIGPNLAVESQCLLTRHAPIPKLLIDSNEVCLFRAYFPLIILSGRDHDPLFCRE